MSKKEIIGLLVAGIIFAIVLAIVLSLKLIDVAQAIQIIITFVLVLVTVVYVKRTADIAKATKQQADASMKMAEEMREQWQSEARPHLLLRLKDGCVPWDPNSGGVVGAGGPMDWKPFTVMIANGGKGPAVNICAGFWFPEDVSPFLNSVGYLMPGQECPVSIMALPMVSSRAQEKTFWLPELRKRVGHHKPGVVAVECRDSHSRKWVSYLYLVHPVNDASIVLEGTQSIMEVTNQ
ncbi:MAG: hypothetical protein Q8P44_01180 [Dehalococcoidia bacterium]|nr:hypothetical protein [Dehalococcoidia bacterium]